MPDRDVQYIRFIGTLVSALGLGLLLITGLGTIFALFAGITADTSAIIQGGLTILLAFIMATGLVSCGAQIQRVHLSAVNIENLRLVWTTLVLLMGISLGTGLWLGQQPLAFLAALILLALFSARGAIIRLTRRY